MNKAIFLDDQLFQYFTENTTPSGQSDHMVKIIRDLYSMCDDYKADHLNKEMTMTDVYLVLKRTFNYWDLFVEKVTKKYPEAKIIVTFLTDYSYEKLFLKNTKAKELFEQARSIHQINLKMK